MLLLLFWGWFWQNSPKTVENLLEDVVRIFPELDSLYRNAPIEKRRELIGSIYPEKLTFDGQEHRTARLNEAVELMFLINRELGYEKSRTNSGNLKLAGLVPRAGVEPAHQKILVFETNASTNSAIWAFTFW